MYVSCCAGWVTPLCLGGSILSSVPIAYLNDLVTAKDRAQAQVCAVIWSCYICNAITSTAGTVL